MTQFAQYHTIRFGMEFHMPTGNAFVPVRMQIHIIAAAQTICVAANEQKLAIHTTSVMKCQQAKHG